MENKSKTESAKLNLGKSKREEKGLKHKIITN